MIDKDYLLEQVTEKNILDILKHFNISPHNIKNNEIWFKTICHRGDSHKLCYYKDSKTFYCYTNCGFMTLFSLIMKINNLTFIESLNFIAGFIGINYRKGFNHAIYRNAQDELACINKYLSIRRRNKKREIKHLTSIENPLLLEYFEDNVFYNGWIEEGISIDSMQRFNILWYEVEKYIIIPHYNMQGGVIGIRRRSLQEKDMDNKYMPLILEGMMYAHSLNMNFYGLCQHLQGIKKFKKAVIVESEKSVLLANTYYGDNAFVIATCGFNISNWHRDMLLYLGVEEVIIGFDKDYNVLDFEDLDEDDINYKKFQSYAKRIYSLAFKLTPFFRTCVLWDRFNVLDIKDSPFDKGKETLEFLMKNKIEITTDTKEDV